MTIQQRIQRLEKVISEGKLSSQQQAVEEMRRLVMTLERIDKEYESNSQKEPSWWTAMSEIERLARKFISKYK